MYNLDSAILYSLVELVEDMRSFFKQLRLETGLRICNKVYEFGDKPSKVSDLTLCLYFKIAHFGIHSVAVHSLSGGCALPSVVLWRKV